MANATGDLTWSGNENQPVPAIGATVNVNIAGIGAVVVKGYFAEDGYLGFSALMLTPPEWWRKQNHPGREPISYFFGVDLQEPSAIPDEGKGPGEDDGGDRMYEIRQ